MVPKAGFKKRRWYNGVVGVRNTCINGHWARSGGWREGRAVDWELKWELLKWEVQLCKEGESQFVSPSSCFKVSVGAFVEKWFNLSSCNLLGLSRAECPFSIITIIITIIITFIKI